jgi:hypothetical protein
MKSVPGHFWTFVLMKLLTKSCSIALALCVGMIFNPAYGSMLFGIIDSNGNVIVPIKFASITSNQDGSFFLSEQPDQQHLTAVDRDGHLISRSCPPLAASPGAAQKSQIADRSQQALHFKYSVSQAKIVEGPKGIGVTDFAGRIIIPPIYVCINPIFVTRKADDDRIYVATVQNHHAPAATPTKFLIKTPGKTEDPELYTASTMDPWFFIVFDRNGKELTRLSAATRVNSGFFQEGLLKINPPALKTPSFMDANGKIALTLKGYDSADTFSNGLSYVANAAGSSWVDRTGKQVIGPFKNACLGRFGKERGIVQFYRNGKPFVGAVDRAGVFRIPADYESLNEFSGDWFLAAKNHRLQLIDKNNNLICQFPKNCTEVTPVASAAPILLLPCAFNGDLHSDQAQPNPHANKKWGYGNLRGEIVIPPYFDAVESFQGPIARVALTQTTGESLWGVIDRTGKWIITPTYDTIDIEPNNRLIVGVEHNEYAADDWKSGRGHGRDVLFVRLLQQYDFITMSKTELINLLGKADSIDPDNRSVPAPIESKLYYAIIASSCGNGCVGVEFGFDKAERIWGWRLFSDQRFGEWNSTNVVAKSAENCTFIPKKASLNRDR